MAKSVIISLIVAMSMVLFTDCYTLGCGRYPVVLDNCGPAPAPLCPLNAPGYVTGPIVRPTIALPAVIPAPQTIGHACSCVKTVVKPQPIQQLITVPSVQPYLETNHIPVLDNIQYEAVPVNCPPVAPELSIPSYLPSLGCSPYGYPAPPCY